MATNGLELVSSNSYDTPSRERERKRAWKKQNKTTLSWQCVGFDPLEVVDDE